MMGLLENSLGVQSVSNVTSQSRYEVEKSEMGWMSCCCRGRNDMVWDPCCF